MNAPAILDVLSPREAAALHKAEATINNHLRSVVPTGEALIAIQTDRLYRATHSRFEDYCASFTPPISRGHAYNLMSAARTHRQMSAIADTLPDNIVTYPTQENHFRVLNKLKDTPELQVVAFLGASLYANKTGKDLTASLIQKFVDQAQEIEQTGVINVYDQVVAIADVMTISMTQEDYEAHQRQLEGIQRRAGRRRVSVSQETVGDMVQGFDVDEMNRAAYKTTYDNGDVVWSVPALVKPSEPVVD